MVAEDTAVEPTKSDKLTLLLLDDEVEITNALQRLLRKDYDVVPFNDGMQAIQHILNNPVDLIISDMRMPLMDGAEFLAQVRNVQPDAVRILLSGYSDMESTIKAINVSGIFTYIAKPWDNDNIKLSLAKAAEYYRLKKESKTLAKNLSISNKKLAELNQSLEKQVSKRTEALQKTMAANKNLLHDIIDMMAASIEFRTGSGVGHMKRIALQCRGLAKVLGLEDAELRRIHLCGLLHEFGLIGLSDEKLAAKNEADWHAHPVIGAKMMGRISRFIPLVPIILHQNENFDGTGVPELFKGKDIPIGSRILRIVKDFDYLVVGNKNHKKLPFAVAEVWMRERAGKYYDPEILTAFFNLMKNRLPENTLEMEYTITLRQAKIGDTLAEDLVLPNGHIMLKSGFQLIQETLIKLRETEENLDTTITLFIL